ncbi:oncostatin-M-specific receptor subunit beta-like isoform X1 [Mytilus galloprovincialis]|uniref:oncostatin-M-specific receptor subunit beta-like isoform X1 n=1 Tax=Mytilus galloprovincialis TaxID=29158 RepID=UPI003F7BE95D
MLKIGLIILCVALVRELVGSVWSSEQSFYDNYSGEDVVYDDNNQYKPKFSLDADVNLLAGQKFQVDCSCRPPVNCSTCKLEINSLKIKQCTTGKRASCKVKDTVITDNRTISLVRPNVSEQDTGTYFCQYNNSATTEDNFYLKIGDKPSGPQNISCVSNDMKDLNCSWTKSKQDKENPLPIVYKSFFDTSPMYGKINCPHPQPTKRDQTSCYIAPSTTDNYYTFHAGNSYNVIINASNVCAFQMTKHTVNITEVIKLSSPKVSPLNITEREIILSTKQSEVSHITIWTNDSILYDVVYSSDTTTSTTQFSSPNESNVINLPDLIPNTAYNITVKAKNPKSKGDKYWSPNVTVNYTTKPAAPVSVPYIGGYIMSKRVLFLYIRPISKREKFSENASYIVTVKSASEDPFFKQLNVTWDIAMINVTDLPQSISYLIEVKTLNDIGESIDSSRITTPLYDSGRPKPAYIVVEGSGKNYFVSWDTQSRNISSQLEKIVVYWCVGIQSVCQSNLNFINVSGYLTNISVTTDREDRWIFAVSFLYIDGYNTEMVFSNCHFPQFTGGPLGISDISVIPESKTELVVKPGDYCNINKYPSRPLVYTVYYRKSEDNIKSCDHQTFLQKRVEANIKTGGITLENLKPSTNYVVCLGVTSNGGDEEISDPQMALTLSTDTPLPVGTKILIIVFCSIVFIVGTFLCIWKVRKMYNNIDTRIITPYIKPSPQYIPVPSTDIENPKEKTGGSSSDSGVSVSVQDGEFSNQTDISSHNLQISDSNFSKDIPANDTLESRPNNVELTESQSEDNVEERDRTVSNTTDGYTGTFKSSRTSKSGTSNHTSTTNSSRFSRPKQKRSSVVDRFEPEIREETSYSSSKLVPLMEKNSADEIKNKTEFVKDWIRKSTEDLHDSHDIQLQTFTPETNQGQVESYVEVAADGSLKSDSVNQSSNHSNSNHINNICSNSTSSGYTAISDIINQNSSNYSDRSNSIGKSDSCKSENGNSKVQCSIQMKENRPLSYVQSDNLSTNSTSVNSEDKDSNQIGENSLSSYVQSDILSTFSVNSNEGSNTSTPAVKINTLSLNSTSEKCNEGSFTSSPAINIDISSLNSPLENNKSSNTNTHTINIDNSSLEKSKQKNIFQNKLFNQDKVEKFAATDSQYLPHIQILTIKEPKNFSDNKDLPQDENSGDISSSVSDYLKAGQCDTNSGSEQCDSNSGSEQISSYTHLDSVGENL